METNVDWSQALHATRKECKPEKVYQGGQPSTNMTAIVQNFRQEVLLSSWPRPDGKLAGTISAAHEGGVLEAVNMALSAFDKHYVDRDLERTGLSIVIITAGTAHFNVDKNMLRLTSERMIEGGLGIDLVSLAKMPLHAVPLFKFQGSVSASSAVGVDHLYVEDDATKTKESLYFIPYWVDSSCEFKTCVAGSLD